MADALGAVSTRPSRHADKPMLLCFMVGLWIAANAQAESRPEILHYQFDGTGNTTPNLASAPPAGTETADLRGGIVQGPPNLNFSLSGGGALNGSGLGSSTDFLDTHWAPNLGSGSWTISFISSGFGSSTATYYVFGDTTSGGFRCFTNGSAGNLNWVLRGAGLVDVYIYYGAVDSATRNTFVYDQSQGNVRGYRDGELVSFVNQGLLNLTGQGPFKVMGYGSLFGPPSGARIDDFRLYNRALSSNEVRDIDAHVITSVLGNSLLIANGDNTPSLADHTDFGGVPPASGAMSRTYTIENLSNQPIRVSEVSLSGSNAADFFVTTQTTSPVAFGQTTSVAIGFDPSAEGTRRATVSFSVYDQNTTPNINHYAFDIQGEGLGDFAFRDGFESVPLVLPQP